MIKSSAGLKAKVRNIAGGKDNVSKAYIRIFFMERFMERVSCSEYKDHFILKGGMLVASILGINVRAMVERLAQKLLEAEILCGTEIVEALKD